MVEEATLIYQSPIIFELKQNMINFELNLLNSQIAAREAIVLMNFYWFL
jgi:hypothetical protein